MLHERIYLNENDKRIYFDTYIADERYCRRPAMLVIPGGGYRTVCTDREGEPIALAYFAKGDFSAITIRSLFFGNVAGAIGTVSIICILVAGIILMAFKITDYIIPVGSIITFIAVIWAMLGATAILPYLFSGSFLFVTMFMLPEPTTSPIPNKRGLFSISSVE